MQNKTPTLVDLCSESWWQCNLIHYALLLRKKNISCSNSPKKNSSGPPRACHDGLIWHRVTDLSPSYFKNKVVDHWSRCHIHLNLNRLCNEPQ